MNIIIILIEKEKQLPITQAERGSTPTAVRPLHGPDHPSHHHHDHFYSK